MAQPEEVIKVTLQDVTKDIDAERIKFEFPKSVIERYTNAEHEWRSMLAFIRENSNNCTDISMNAPKYLRKRFSLSYEWRHMGLAWYLLDEYFKGNITIKNEELQPEQ